jgi:dTDP-4-amino-4,6-dideoxygalactose transaminase
MKIDFFKHNVNKVDINNVVRVLQTIFLTTGEDVSDFEKELAAYTGNKYAIGVTSCTDALFLAAKYLGFKPGDEVITTPMSFIATANVIEYCGATPVFVDVEADTGNIDASLIEAAITKKTKGIILTHLYGQMCDMKKISSIAKKHNLKVIEDAAHCIEGTRDGVKVGELSDAACYSFYPTKNITSGEGGAVSTNNQDMYEWLKSARSHGMSKNAADRYTKRYQHYDMEFLGYKCNMTNIQAALVINQLKRIDSLLDKREKVAQKYNRGFSKNSNISIPKVKSNSKHARHLYTIWVKPAERDSLLSKLGDAGIGVAVNFRTIHLMKYYREKYGYLPGSFPIAEHIGNSTITLPFYPKLSGNEIDQVIKTVNQLTE